MCERAEELIPLAEEIDEVNPGLLNGVFFFAGNARNPGNRICVFLVCNFFMLTSIVSYLNFLFLPEHLILCGVETARVVTVIRPPIVSCNMYC
jgi:hypothetical protein